MSTPRKQLPPEIYMRRRAAALIAILVVVIALIVAWAALRGGGEEPTNTAATAPAATSAIETASTPPATSQEATEEAAAGDSSTPRGSEDEPSQPQMASESAAPASAEAEKKTCELADLKVTVSTDQPTYAAGAQPVFYMSVENPTAADCIIDLDKEQIRFETYRMGTNVRQWADTDCNAPIQTGVQTFKAKETRFFSATWSRKTSEPGQCDAREDAPAFAYFVHALIGSNNSPSQDFQLL